MAKHNSEDIITLTIDDDMEVNCSVVGIFNATNGKAYIALLPLEGDDADTGEVYLYGYTEDASGEPCFENILDDEEFEIANDAFDQMLDDMQFDELMEK